jgi:hypothetical protein
MDEVNLGGAVGAVCAGFLDCRILGYLFQRGANYAARWSV